MSRFRLVDARSAWFMMSVVMVLGAVTRGAAPVAGAPTPPLPQDQKNAIDAENAPEKLIELAKNYSLQRAIGGANAAIEKAVKLQPNLLTDVKVQSPRSWNEYWFTQRAALQEQKLARNDAAGRVKLAQWLYDAGLTSQAGQMLTGALTLNKELPEALALSKKWGLGTGGPGRITFAYGVSAAQPLFLEMLKDQTVDIMLQRNHVFFIIPVAYRTTDTHFAPAKGSIKVTSDDGKPCAVRGIALLEAPGATTDPNLAPDPSKPPDLKWPSDSEPFYERMQLQQKADKTGYELLCYNTTPPIARPQLRPAGNSRDRKAQPAPPPRAPGTAGTGGKDSKNPSGYIAFVTEIPQATQSVTIEYRGLDPLKVDIAFLRALGMSKDTAIAEREEMLELLVKAAGSPDEPIATAAVWKLAALKSPSSSGLSGQSAEGMALPGAVDKINKALLSAMGQPEGVTRQAAFKALFRKEETAPESVLQQIRSYPDSKIPLGLLDAIQVELARAATEAASLPPPAPSGLPGNTPAAKPAEGLPPSSAPPSLFAAAAACLAHKDPKVAQRAIDVLLADGTKESVDALSHAVGPARELLTAQLGKSSPILKGYLLRVLLPKADGPTAARLMQSAGPISLTITRDDDPLFSAMSTASSPQTLQLIIEMLIRADLSAVSGSGKLRESLLLLTNSQMKDKGVRTALLELALAQIKRMPYEAPVKRERGSTGEDRPGAAFEEVLGLLASNCPDPSIARPAALALVASGRIAPLENRFTQTDPKRRLEIIQWLLREKTLLGNPEALTIFLAGRIADSDAKTAREAVVGLTNIKIDPKRRWSFHLAVSQRIDMRVMVDHSLSQTDEYLSKGAMRLIYDLTQMPSVDRTEYEAAAVHDPREQKIMAIESNWTSKPAGLHAVMLYVDLKPFAQTTDGARLPIPPSTSPATPRVPQLSVPLPAGEVLFQPAGNTVKVIYQGNDIGISFIPGALGGTPPSILKINAGALLRSALNSPEIGKYLPSDQIDLMMINDVREGDIKYERLGTWGGEFQYADSVTGAVAKDYKFMGAKVFFQQIPAK